MLSGCHILSYFFPTYHFSMFYKDWKETLHTVRQTQRYVKDIFNPKLFPKAIYSPQMSTHLYFMPKSLNCKGGEEITYLLRRP